MFRVSTSVSIGLDLHIEMFPPGEERKKKETIPPKIWTVYLVRRIDHHVAYLTQPIHHKNLCKEVIHSVKEVAYVMLYFGL